MIFIIKKHILIKRYRSLLEWFTKDFGDNWTVTIKDNQKRAREALNRLKNRFDLYGVDYSEAQELGLID